MTRQLEKRLENDWLNNEVPDVHSQRRVWLGPVPPGPDSRMFMVIGKWADIILFEPTLITIVEAKLTPDAKAVGQLEMYEQEFRKTLRFQRYWPLDIKKVLLTTRVDNPVKEITEAHGIEYVVYRPDWIPFWENRKFRL